MRVALYLRRSTSDLQPDSLVAQRERLTAWSTEHGHVIVATFEDSASGRFVDGRDSFLDMIEVVKGGASFEAILVRDVARWSRAENIDLAGYYEFICRSHGVAVIYVDEPFAPDQSPYSLLQKHLKRAMVAEFSMERARMTIAMHARVVAMGFWPLGSPPFAMKRVLVDAASGAPIRDMALGEKKTLSTQRIKLAPGDPADVATVQTIFALYARGGRTLKEIADQLNRDGIPSSRGSVWCSPHVGYILHNEAYAGTLVYHVRGQDTPSALKSRKGSPNEKTIRCENAHEAIVTKDLWAAAQKKQELTTWRRTDLQVLDDLRHHMERWQITIDPDQLPSADELRKGFGSSDAEVIDERFRAAKARVREQLATQFQIDEVEEGLVVNRQLLVAFECSLPHARFGSLQFRFSLARHREEDVVLGLAFSPPPRVQHVETFFFRIPRNGNLRKDSNPPLAVGKVKTRLLRSSPETSLADHFVYCLRYRRGRAEKAFLDEARSHGPLLNLKAIAKALGWSLVTTSSMYRRLDRRGEMQGFTPPLRRIRVTCPHCGGTRMLLPRVVLALKTDVCFECLQDPVERTPNTHVGVCPLCGERRLRSLYERESRTADVNTLCAACESKVDLLRRRNTPPSV